ncbi:MAG: hydrogenase formation protein HypD [Candidatus Omnitrophota bacterium]|nr:hydrogenase formation protein HypD [Candidatus Omnitrophota bacterium]
MKYVDEFRDRRLIEKVAGRIRMTVTRDRAYRIMEVCGTHTMSIFRFGLKDILPANINLISGPGCPVCVTPNGFIDKAIALAGIKDVVIATFGDMLRVPGSYSTLEKERAGGAAVRIVYSTMDALSLAKKNPEKEIVFLGIGFETTAPTVARSILEAKRGKINNYSVLCGHKTMPEALKALVDDRDFNIDGFLLPGHVSAVIGVKPYEFLPKRYGRRCVIAGFEPLDIMQAILMLIAQNRPKVDVQYTRIIEANGNALARKCIKDVFRKAPSMWRGIGVVKDSGLEIKDKYSGFNAELRFKIKGISAPKEDKSCICGEVLRGVSRPSDCALFANVCSPEHPVGACMVSSEGTCAAYYRYGR